jgi:hypothetical protein
MNRYTAIYNGQCYINGYGRKLYKKGILLSDIRDSKGNLVTPSQKFTLFAFFKDNNLSCGQKISFVAMKQNNKIISPRNFQII